MADVIVTPQHHLGHIILDGMKKHTDFTFQIDGATGEEETYQSALKRTVQLAKSLRKYGFKPGDVLAVGGRNNIHMRIPFYAALFNGLSVLCVDPFFKYDEIKTLFKITSPKVAFCEKDAYNTYLSASRDLGLDTKIIALESGDNSMPEFVKEYGDDEPVENFKVAEIDTDTLYPLLVCTSGTTGKIKVAAFHHQPITKWMLFHTGTRNYDMFLGKKILKVAPINWISSYFVAIASPIMGHCQLQTSDPDNIDVLINMINKYKPITTIMSPALAKTLLNRKDEIDFSSFVFIALGGSRVYPELLTELQSCLRPGAFAFDTYGSTETIGSAIRWVPGSPRGSCGTVYPERDVKLVDPETGKEITEANVPGEMWVKDPGFKEYLNDPEETANCLSEDGYFKSGDLLYRDENNFFFFVDRIRALIKYRNYHVTPGELEEVILELPGVREVCVVGVEDPEDGQRPVACVVRAPDSDVTEQEIKQLVADKLSEKKELRGGVIFMDALPHTSTGKIARRKLMDVVKGLYKRN